MLLQEGPVLGLVFEEGMLEQLSGSWPLGRIFLKTLTDHFPKGFPVHLVLLFVLRPRVQIGRVVLQRQHQYLKSKQIAEMYTNS